MPFRSSDFILFPHVQAGLSGRSIPTNSMPNQRLWGIDPAKNAIRRKSG
jgi:hypothetical protein